MNLKTLPKLEERVKLLFLSIFWLKMGPNEFSTFDNRQVPAKLILLF
jgi:hypothetical protein